MSPSSSNCSAESISTLSNLIYKILFGWFREFLGILVPSSPSPFDQFFGILEIDVSSFPLPLSLFL